MEFKISEFFYHLLDYGGFSFKEGNILMWGDPDIMLLPESFLILKESLEKGLGSDGNNLFYWLGYTYGKNATDVLVSKFGFNSKDFDKFTNGGTQDGFGYIKILTYFDETKPVDSYLKATNCILAETAKKQGLNKNVDDYICGMMAGCAERLVNRVVVCEEEKCIANGSDHCYYHIIERPNDKMPGLILKSEFNQDELHQKIMKRYMNRKFSTKFLEKKEVSFGDGGFVLRGTRGVLLPITDLVILNTLCQQFGDYKRILLDATNPMARLCNQSKIISKDAINHELGKLEIFGLGKFRVFSISDNNIMIENENSQVPIEHREIYGISAKPVCNLSEALICSSMGQILGKKVTASEYECISQGKKKCIFSLNILE
jgi:predicted hydrocarbon binding protein